MLKGIRNTNSDNVFSPIGHALWIFPCPDSKQIPRHLPWAPLSSSILGPQRRQVHSSCLTKEEWGSEKDLELNSSLWQADSQGQRKDPRTGCLCGNQEVPCTSRGGCSLQGSPDSKWGPTGGGCCARNHTTYIQPQTKTEIQTTTTTTKQFCHSWL